ncbi:hypothetical protein CYY_007418 [Polysphondylium violaceum]|uniref:beta-aspartyl-peptidase n=1 Tax=Polysphondylium violaceum TaxID=133409 RepID=A0A8J4PNN2_9MYCE|nr:hypothetical protein CYY_007418 [Polysphondylium violaceum]
MDKAIIVIHGGAGTIIKANMTDEKEEKFLNSLKAILVRGREMLSNGSSALDVVQEAVRMFEEDTLYNAGRGSVFTSDAINEMDASIMDGRNIKAGGVASVSTIRNPIIAARKVMECTPHVLLIGKGAELFAQKNGVEIVDPSFFYTENRYQQLLRAKEEQSLLLDHDGANKVEERKQENSNDSKATSTDPIDPDKKFGTVGAVALDIHGNLASATSTGGMTNKMTGRVGDSPIIGAGCYANNKTVAVSTTGTGEMFMRTLAAYDVSAMMEYTGCTVEEAAKKVVFEKLLSIQGEGGLIAVDKNGNFSMTFNSEGMYRGYCKVNQEPNAFIYE